MTKKHFIAAAEMVRSFPEKDRETLVLFLVRFFRSFNPRFRESTFRQACGVPL